MTRSIPISALWAGVTSLATSTNRTFRVDGSVRTRLHSSRPSMSPTVARLTMTSWRFHSSIVSAKEALGATAASAPLPLRASSTPAARVASESTTSTFMREAPPR